MPASEHDEIPAWEGRVTLRFLIYYYIQGFYNII